MDAGEYADRVDQAVQAAPVAGEASLPGAGRCHRERHEEHEGREADGDVRAVREIRQERHRIEAREQHEVRGEVHHRVAERGQPEGASVPHEARPAQQPRRRRHRQRRQQHAYGPLADVTHDRLRRVGTECRARGTEFAQEVVGQDPERYAEQHAERRLCPSRMERRERLHRTVPDRTGNRVAGSLRGRVSGCGAGSCPRRAAPLPRSR